MADTLLTLSIPASVILLLFAPLIARAVHDRRP